MALRVLGPFNSTGAELVVPVPASKSWTLQSIAGSMGGTGGGTDRRTLVLSFLSSVDAGNDLFRDVLFDENGPLNDIFFCAAVGMAGRRKDMLGNPYVINALPAISLPSDAVIRFDSGGVSLSEIFILVDEK